MSTAWMPIADGVPGIAQILLNLQGMKNYYGSLPSVRAAALSIGGTRTNNDQLTSALKLADYVRRGLVYQADPFNAELTQTPDVLLMQINRQGYAAGDCDDHVLLYAALAESLGIFTEIVGVMAPGADTYNHVIVITWPNEVSYQLDLCAKEGQQPIYSDVLYP